MPLKLLFVLRSSAHFAYHATTLDHLVRGGHQVSVLFDRDPKGTAVPGDRGLRHWLRQSGSRVEVARALQRRNLWRALLFHAREARAYASYRRRGPEFEYYRHRTQGSLARWLNRFSKTTIGDAIFRAPRTDRLLKLVERLVPADGTIVAALRAMQPDCVIASPTNMSFDEEVEYIKAAKQLGIPTIVPVLSWDNLSTKGLVPICPDVLLAWHHGHQRDARVYHGIAADRVVISGSPFFDKWFDDQTPIAPRATVCSRQGLDPSRPYLVYLGSSTNIAQNEAWVVVQMMKALRKRPATADLQVIFKPHPANSPDSRVLARAGVTIWPREEGLPDTPEAARRFRDLLHHGVCAIGINTTGMVDAVLCDRPTIALRVDAYRRTQEDTEHFQRMLQSKAMYFAESMKQMATLVDRCMQGEDTKSQDRERFARTFARPRGIGAQAGEAAALAIEMTCARKAPVEIAAELDRLLNSRPAPVRPVVAEWAQSEPAPAAAPGSTHPEDRRVLPDVEQLEEQARLYARHFSAHLSVDSVPVVIGVPMHNNGTFLTEALTSILAQDFPNFGLFLFDDASTDDTAAVARRFAERDPRVVYERSDGRSGMVEAWRQTYLRARRRFPSARDFAWASAHDRCDARWLGALVAVFEERPKVVLSYPLVRRMDPSGKLHHSIEPTHFDSSGMNVFDQRWEHFCRTLIGSGNMVYGLIRVAALERTGIFRPVIFPDRLLMAELSIEGEIHQVNQELWFRRQTAVSSVERQRRTLFGPSVPLAAQVLALLMHLRYLHPALKAARSQAGDRRRAPWRSMLTFARFELQRKWVKLRLKRQALPAAAPPKAERAPTARTDDPRTGGTQLTG